MTPKGLANLIPSLAKYLIRNQLEPDIDGGVQDFLKIFTCIVELRGAENSRYGSGVLLKRGWVLTAAHCIQKPPALLVWNRYEGKEYAVRSVHWQSGYRHQFNKKDTWPIEPQSYKGQHDELVLLKLEKNAFPGDEVFRLAQLPDGASPSAVDYLIVGGWGKDGDGNQAKEVRVAVARHLGTEPNGRGAIGFRRTDFFNGMPRGGDSGAPVFFPSPRYPILHLFRLAGIHVSSDTPDSCNCADQAEKGYFLPISRSVEHWIKRVMSPKATSINRTSSTSRNSKFTFRGTEKCEKIPNASVLCEKGGNAISFTCYGKGVVLPSEFTMNFENGGAQSVTMSFVDVNGVQREVPLKKGGIAKLDHWFDGSDPGDGIHFFVFRREDGGGKRKVRVEAFLEPTNHPKPNCKNFSDPDIPASACPKKSVDETAVLFNTQDDQDDEGNGTEK